MPPLTISEEELDSAVDILDRVLARIEGGAPK
jgi:4-aminobutyrate aminotransferase-like enzyme